MTRTYRSTD